MESGSNNRNTIHAMPIRRAERRNPSDDVELDFDIIAEQNKRFSDTDIEMSLRERQEAINTSHPFGMRLWKPALYKKSRTIEEISNNSIHEIPVVQARLHKYVWLEFATPGNILWSVLFGSWMSILYISVLLIFIILTLPASIFSDKSRKSIRMKRILMWRMAWFILWPFGKYISKKHSYENSLSSFLTPNSAGRIINDAQKSWGIDIVYYSLTCMILVPVHYLVSFLNVLLVVTIPMAKLNMIIPKQLVYDPDSLEIAAPTAIRPNCEILLCTYNAIGMQYYKYTYDGINIIFINMLLIVLLALVDGYLLAPLWNDTGLGHPLVVFCLCLVSVVPLAYFIGMSVASISSQSSLGLGAVINATFGSIVEIILYWMMIVRKKGVIVEGAIIGSFLGTLLLLPGVSMISGGIGRWKEQRFNVKSAGVSTVLLIMALIGAFTPTLFYSIFGGHELRCGTCTQPISEGMTALDVAVRCQGCNYVLPHDLASDPFFSEHVQPLMYWCAGILPSAYLVGLIFMLKTHSRQIYDCKKHDSSILLDYSVAGGVENHESAPHIESEGVHEAPEWSKLKSTVILLVSTVLFALLAELLVHSVDSVIASLRLDAKFLGLTLFALVPSFTEFMNAIMFARQGNVALSLEIGSAYVVQIALIQIPLLVAFSAFWNIYDNGPQIPEQSFTLIFPQWDVYAVFFGVFLLSYTYIEGKSNYFKGSILVFSYMVLLLSFYYV